MIHWISTHLELFRRNEDGVTAIEYSAIIALFSGTLLIALPNIGTGIANPFTQLTSAVNESSGSSASSGDDSEGENESDTADSGESDDGADSEYGGDSEYSDSSDYESGDDGESEDS